MPEQTVTRALESGLEPGCIYATLANASLIPQWAPVFADVVQHMNASAYRVTKGEAAFDIELVANEASLTVDYLREMSQGRRGGAYIRVIPRPLGGSVITMTVPVGPGTTPAEVAAVLEQELEALLTLAASDKA